MISKNALLTLSLLCNIALLTLGAVRYHYTHKPATITTSYNYKNGEVRQAVYCKMPIDTTDIVFIGTSITEGFPVYELFPNKPVKNRGISGNWSWQIVARLPQIVAAQPRKIFLEMGVNDLIYKVSVDSILINYKKAIELVKTGSPNTELYINSLTPTTYTNSALNPAIIQVNERLQQLCKQYSITYINLYRYMVRGQALDPSLTVDGLHYNAKAYLLWRQQINPFIY